LPDLIQFPVDPVFSFLYEFIDGLRRHPGRSPDHHPAIVFDGEGDRPSPSSGSNDPIIEGLTSTQTGCLYKGRPGKKLANVHKPIYISKGR
jgi:hypothetical protein